MLWLLAYLLLGLVVARVVFAQFVAANDRNVRARNRDRYGLPFPRFSAGERAGVAAVSVVLGWLWPLTALVLLVMWPTRVERLAAREERIRLAEKELGIK